MAVQQRFLLSGKFRNYINMYFFQSDAEKSAPFLIESYFREQALLLLWPGHVGLSNGGGALAPSFTAMTLGRSLNLSEPLIPSLQLWIVEPQRGPSKPSG